MTELENTLLIVQLIMCILGLSALIIVIPTFLLAKELRSHPGTLIMCICLLEFSLFYYAFFLYFISNDHLKHYKGLNIALFCSRLIDISTFHIIHIDDYDILLFIELVADNIILKMLLMYYEFLSVDVVLVIRNPFYSPARRSKIYHLSAILFPLIAFLAVGGMNIYIYIYLALLITDQKTAGLILSYSIDLPLSGILVLSSIGSFIYSQIYLNQLKIQAQYKTNFLCKMRVYQIFSLIYGSCVFIRSLIGLKYKYDYYFQFTLV